MTSGKNTQEHIGLFQVIFEKGVETLLNPDDGSWYFQSVRHGAPVKWTPGTERDVYDLRPILMLYNDLQGIQENLLSPDVPSSHDLHFSVETSLLGKSLSVENFHDLVYAFGAVTYHCKRLAYEYCSIAKDFARSKARSEGEDTGEAFAFVKNCNVFYEIDALITAARQCYSTIRTVLWNVYRSEAPFDTTRPRSFEPFLNASEQYLPGKLHTQLKTSWNGWGKQVKGYRDIIQHNFTLTETGWPLPKAKHIENGIWCVSVLLPDDPEEKSRRKFVFDKNIDVLTYGWKLAVH